MDSDRNGGEAMRGRPQEFIPQTGDKSVNRVERNMSDEGVDLLCEKLKSLDVKIGDCERSLEISCMRIAGDVKLKRELEAERDRLRKDYDWATQFAKPAKSKLDIYE